MWGNNQNVTPTPGATIIVVNLGENFTVKGHHLSMIKDHQFDGHRVLLKLDWSKDIKAKPIRKTIAFAKSSNDSKLMEKMDALTTKIDSHFKDIKGEIKEMRDRCNSCEGPHPSLKCDDKPIEGPKDKEANYAYGGYRGGGYRGDYYGRSSGNWRYRQQKDENQNS
nr:reverse transcriptase domain-containing protein [Tanacetum cinerariifolium]